ncbi:MAG: alpha/beta fold hydrolase [Rickettsiales bacterium]
MVIYNRGGNREFGKLAVGQILFMSRLIKAFPAGILASNYRGNDGGEGKDEFGGSDIHDVLDLIEAGKKEPWWDGKNIFMVGGSRGGMMTYLAIKHGAPLNAAVAWAGPTDLFAAGKERPEMEENVHSKIIPGGPEARDAEYRERSAIFWPEKLDKPLLILHGDADWRVDVHHARDLAKKLKELKKPYSYIEFSGDDHFLTKNKDQVIPLIADWFRSHLKQKDSPQR